MSHKKKTTWNDIEHESFEKAAEANYATSAAMRYRIRQGYTSDADMEAYHSMGSPVIYQGVPYRSLACCARIHLKTDYAMQKLIKLDVNNAKN